MTVNNQKTTAGFALLITLLMVGVILSVTLAIVELGTKQLALSVSARDSEVAFQAANAALECAERVRRSASSTIELGNELTFDCFGKSVSVINNASALLRVKSGNFVNNVVSSYQTSNMAGISWAGSAADDRCSEIDLLAEMVAIDAPGPLVIDAKAGNHSLKNLFPNYSSASKSCPPGGKCTLAVARGYSAPCGQKNAVGVQKREILLEF